MAGNNLKVQTPISPFVERNTEKTINKTGGQKPFEIEKNPQRPFLVYANELVTKVLGTSFSIKAFKLICNTLINTI